MIDSGMLSDNNALSYHMRLFEEKRRENYLIDLNEKLENEESNEDDLSPEVVDMTFFDRYFDE